MPFIKKFLKDFYIKDNRIYLSNEFLNENRHNFKKITGSRFCNILGLSKYNTPVQTWASMVNIYKDEIDPMLAKTGNYIEPKIRDYASRKLNVNFISYDPIKIKWDKFPDNPIYGGIPDGEPVDDNGNLYYPNYPMLEIKTSSIDRLVYEKIDGSLQMTLDKNGYPLVKKRFGKFEEWFENGKIVVKTEYKFQLGLYLYLRKINKGLFAICFLETSDYVEPEKFDISNRKIYFVEMHLTENKIKPFIENGIKWYEDYIYTGFSPQLTSKDIEWLRECLPNYE
ncbi:MPN551 family DNA-binding protein [Mycoplasmoides alvi]|uniref:MPN551 family DNA-binding protein n=1 Tax=Mycoplasmoides alvi TaxID=78580 RepID=UPI00051BBA93|nr:YqaJ viral recombinase family protein [Mycoplasmoides alvi]